MKYWIAVFIALIAVAAANPHKGKYNVESNLFGKQSPVKLLMEGVLENGKNVELATYVKVFNQVFPMLKAFTDAVNPEKGEAVKQYRYEWCLRDDRGDPYFCFNLVWNFIIGWQADQFHDDNRFYNLTVTPYAYMNADIKLTLEAPPSKLSFGPTFNFANFTAPLSFEMENKDTLCYAGSLSVAPITINTGITANFIECRITIPEDAQECEWGDPLSARFYQAHLNEGYHSVLLDRTCVHSG